MKHREAAKSAQNILAPVGVIQTSIPRQMVAGSESNDKIR